MLSLGLSAQKDLGASGDIALDYDEYTTTYEVTSINTWLEKPKQTDKLLVPIECFIATV